MPKVKGRGELVTASFDGKAKSYFPSLKGTKDLVLLSIAGNEFCTGEYLEATVKQAVATHQDNPEGKTTFLIADEIYWHNLKKFESSSEDEIKQLKEQAIALGNSYFEKNLSAFLTPLRMTVDSFNKEYVDKTVDEKIKIINQLASKEGLNFEIMRWQTWSNQNDYAKKITAIKPLYATVEGLKAAVDESVEDFAKRHSKNSNEEEGSLWRFRSRDYLMEESPSIMWIAASLGYNFIIYPGAELAPFKATKEYFVVKNHIPYVSNGRNIVEQCAHNQFCIHVADPSRLVNWLDINFKRSPALKVGSNAPKVSDAGFSLFKETKSLKARQRPMLTVKQNDDGVMALSLQQKTVVDSMINGVSRALIETCMINDKTGKRFSLTPSSGLSEIFKGIAAGVLESDMSTADKLEFMIKLIEPFTLPNLTPKNNRSRCASLS